jgi:hypothetical protein
VTAGLVGRHYAGRRVGVVAAVLAAAYPGFWVLELQTLSEPLGLVVVGMLMLVLADLWMRPTLPRALLAGAVSGALALIRLEQLALVVIAVAPILLLNPASPGIGESLGPVPTLTVLVLLAPWTIYNLGRFEEPVVLSTNGYTLHAGNCPATTYSGRLLGFYDIECNSRFTLSNLANLDQSQRDARFRAAALENMRDNVDRLPATIRAPYGRTLAVFRPVQTVGFVASWACSATWPVWAWVTSFWVLAPLCGSVLLRRSRTFQWPLLITLLVVTVAYGEPRYHTPADLGIVVLAAVASTIGCVAPGRSVRARPS